MGTAVTISNQLPRDGLFSDYHPPKGVFDEMLAPTGLLRAPWEQLIGGVHRSGESGLANRSEQVKRSLRENGVTYNVDGAPKGPDRPWELDPLPLMFGKQEWQSLSESLVQRATLLNMILADVYGPMRLVREGVLPLSLVFDSPGYLLPCHGIGQPDQVYLSLYAAHLARQRNGQWLVLADRTRGPSGTGYTLENRIAVSRALRQDFETLHIERLASFYIALQERLVALAPGKRDNPRVVLLTPGARSPTFFEDGYLARYLGYMLVEGGDLTVRGATVYLKTLGGLLPVDVILRRIPDRDSDPLELDPDATFGTAGLVQSLRDGEVVVANAIGSGFLEAPALAAFLPEACRLLLNEDLQCASLRTWWCGRRDDLKYVEANLGQLIVRSALDRHGAQPIVGGDLSRDQRRRLVESIRRHPEHYIAQELAERSTAPVWNGKKIEPWRLELRTFAVAGKDGYQMMPGGLARVFGSPHAIGESMAAGQSSKDVWILSDAPVEPVTLLKQPAKLVELRRSIDDLPSRVADYLYWLGRHAERAEFMVRHLRSCLVRLTNDLEPAGVSELVQLVDALSDGEPPSPRDGDVVDDAVIDALRQEVIDWLFDASRPGALAHTLEAHFNAASQVRDRLSVDSWRIVNQLNLNSLFPWEPRPGRLGDLVLLMNQAINLLAALTGLGTESMTRGLGWRFLDMGRRIERAQQTTRLFRRLLVAADSEATPLLEAILEICGSSMTYRSRYRASLQLAPVLDLLLVDDSNPRSVCHQLNSLSGHVEVIPKMVGESVHSAEQRIMWSAQSLLRLTDVEALCEIDRSGQRDRLESLLVQLEEHLRSLSTEITHNYLTHTGPARQLNMFAAGKLDKSRCGEVRKP
jgi:uncharacterized circularly permuted ATP-grasp superfamily protein/uncharacterized alpha-E superfamily protein